MFQHHGPPPARRPIRIGALLAACGLALGIALLAKGALIAYADDAAQPRRPERTPVATDGTARPTHEGGIGPFHPRPSVTVTTTAVLSGTATAGTPQPPPHPPRPSRTAAPETTGTPAPEGPPSQPGRPGNGDPRPPAPSGTPGRPERPGRPGPPDATRVPPGQQPTPVAPYPAP